MSANLQNMLKEAFLNNSYDLDATIETIKKAYYNSYHYLYNYQWANVRYEQFYRNTNDVDSRRRNESGRLYLNKSFNAVFDIDYDIIGITNREEFRRSKFYQNSFTYDDMVYNPQIFSLLPVVIIDNSVIYDYKIEVSEEYTRFILPFKRNFVLENPRNTITDNVIYKKHTVQVLIIENTYYQRFIYHRGNLSYNDVRKTITIDKNKMISDSEEKITSEVNKYYLKKFNTSDINLLSNDQKGIINREIQRRKRVLYIPGKDGIYFISLHFINENNKGYELGTSLVELIDNGDNTFTAELPINIANKLKGHPFNIYVSVIYFKGLRKHTFYTGKDNIKVLPDNKMESVLYIEKSLDEKYNSPIPIENFIVFRKPVNEVEYYIEERKYMDTVNGSFKPLYPNIYTYDCENLKVGDTLKFYYFYHSTPDLKYYDIYDFFFEFLSNRFTNINTMEEIISNIVYDRNLDNINNIDKIKEFLNKILLRNQNELFKDEIYDYGDIDFDKRYPYREERNNTVSPIEYKDETLKRWIKYDPWLLRDYVLLQKKLGASYFLFTNTMDLSTRLRNDTSLELGSGSLFTFPEERYVFAFNNTRDYPVSLDARVFVDGLLCGDVYQERQNYLDYFYIPKSMVTNDSFIEIEIFPRYKYSKEIKFNSITDKKEISIEKPEEEVFPTVQDIILVEKSTDGDLRYDITALDITSIYDRGEFPFNSDNVHKPVKFTRLKSFTITPNNNMVINKNLKVDIMKLPYMTRFITDSEGYGFVEVAAKDFQLNTDYIRIFKNGRLIPQLKYRLITNYGYPKILLYEWLSVGDVVYIDITPYRYTLLKHIPEIPQGKITIDVKDIINKPFDIRYYDVYLNGRKLSINNVFALSPTTITFTNIKSQYNLDIYEKERDWEYYGLDYNTYKYNFSYEDLIDSGIVTPEEKEYIIDYVIEEKRDDRLIIHENTYDEEPLDYTGIDLLYALYFIFYYDELIPKTYYNPDLIQLSSKVMKDNFNEVYNRYRTTAILNSNTDEERERRKNYPDILYLDPDEFVDSSEGIQKRLLPDGAIAVWVVGHPEEKVDQRLLNKTITIPTNSNLI